MVNFEKLAALTAAITAGNDDEANAIVYGSAAKRDTDASWVNSSGTSVPAPNKDDFYDFLTPAEVGNYSLGDIIKYREIGIMNATNVAGAWQFVFRSENSSGAAIGALTTIIVPETNDNSSVVVYPQAEDSSWINCASSYELLTGGLADGMQEALDAGWVLNIPDHEGFNSSFTAGILEGKITLDSIRALEKSRDITGINNDKFAVAGYSGGSVAAGWAAELQPSYAPDLNIVAFSMGGYVNNLTAVVEKVNKTPYVGFVPAGILGLANEYPEMWDLYDKELKSENTTAFLKALSQCTLADIVQYAGQDIFDYFNDGEGVLSTEIVSSIIGNNTLGKDLPQAPMFIYNGIIDQIVPIETVDKLVDFYCSEGGNVVYNRGAGKDHIGMASVGLPLTFEFFEKAFAGDVPKGCSFEGVLPSFASNFTGTYDGLTNSTNSTSATTSSVASGSSGQNASATGASSATGTSGSESSASASGSASGSDAASNGAAIIAAKPAAVFGLLFAIFTLI